MGDAGRFCLTVDRRNVGEWVEPHASTILLCVCLCLHLFGETSRQARQLVITVHTRVRHRAAALRSNFTVPKLCPASENMRAEYHCVLDTTPRPLAPIADTSEALARLVRGAVWERVLMYFVPSLTDLRRPGSGMELHMECGCPVSFSRCQKRSGSDAWDMMPAKGNR